MLIYVVKQGDTLWQIAKTFNITLDALILANPQLEDPNEILPGERIYLPQLEKGEKTKEPELNSLKSQESPYLYGSSRDAEEKENRAIASIAKESRSEPESPEAETALSFADCKHLTQEYLEDGSLGRDNIIICPHCRKSLPIPKGYFTLN